MQACDRCHRRKSRCNKQHPACAECRKSGAECTYTDRTKEPIYRREHLAALERRLRQAEARNAALTSELATARATSSSAAPSSTTCQSTAPTGIPATVEATEQAAHNVSKSTSGNNVINEVSFLASNAAGDRHYLGSTSGVLFASLVKASVDVISDNQRTNPRADDDRINEPVSTWEASVGTASKPTLPPETLARKLVKSYLAHDHLCYPFLLPSFIISITDLIYGDPSFYVKNHFDAFVFDMVLAIANANVYKYDWQMLPSAESHHSRAMLRISDVFQTGGLKSLQAILLLCQYRMSSSIQDTSASMWHLVGIAVRTTYELGMHRESSYRIDARDENATNHLQDISRQEVSRRCFWCVFDFDRIVSMTLGRPLAINSDDCDVKLPSDEYEHVMNVEVANRSNLERALSRTAIFVHITEYRILCGKIMRCLHGLKKPTSNESSVKSLRDELAAELDQWRLKSQNLNLPDMDFSHKMSEERSSFQSMEWYELLYNNAVLMLYRPSPMLGDGLDDPSMLHKLFIASKKSVSLYAYLHRSRKINYSWITLHSVFMAGLTYIYAVSRHFRERRHPSLSGIMLAEDISTIEIVNDTRACSNVLVAVSERWNALRHCHEVFDRLSDAVLADAIKIQCSPRTYSQLPTVAPPTPLTNSQDNSSSTCRPDMASSNDGRPYVSGQGSSTGQVNLDYYSLSPLAVDSEFRNSFGDLQHIYNHAFVDDPVMQLSQNWLGYIDAFDDMAMLQPQFPNTDIQ